MYRIVHDNNVAEGCHGWTNSSCENMNHVLKDCVRWRPNKLPDLIEKLQNVVDAQYVDADQALLSYSDFVLRPEYVRHCRQRDKAVDLRVRLPASSNVVT